MHLLTSIDSISYTISLHTTPDCAHERTNLEHRTDFYVVLKVTVVPCAKVAVNLINRSKIKEMRNISFTSKAIKYFPNLSLN